MAMTAEKRVKNRVVEILKHYGAYYFYPVTGGFGASGIPDIIVCFNGYFIGIECKAGTNKPTALQEHNLERIKNSGGISMVINEDNVGYVTLTLEKLR
jgi:Holliday junction resolvase